jgi:autotransporter-associated beta strand protein
MKKLLLLSLSLTASCLVHNAGATVTTWDLQGTTGANPYTDSLSGTWENADWSTSQTGQATTQAWVENTAALFAVNSGAGTPAFTVTMNANHTVAGIFDGPLTPNPCPVTIQGSGVITIGGTGGALFANLQGLAISSDAGDPGTLVINVPIAGTLAGAGGLTLEKAGSVYLNAINTYNSGTCVGFSADAFNGICYFTNASASQPGICTSFGSNTIGISNCLGGALLAQGTSAMTVTNAITVYNTAGQSINLSSAAAPSVTFSGPFSLGTNTLIVGAGQSPSLTIISGVISGSGGFVRGEGSANNGTLELTATNTFTGTLTISNGTLTLGPTGAVSNAANIFISAGGTFDVSAVSSPYSLSSSTTLNASGTGTAVGSTAASINGAASGVVNLGAQPINLTFDGGDPALYISQGALTLNGNLITVNPPYQLGAGTYTLIQVAGGIINGTPGTNVAVAGAGLSYNCLASIQVANGNVNLVVVQGGFETWNGNDVANSSNWSDGTNWNSGTPPDQPPIGDALTFTGSTGLTPVMDNSYSIYSLTFDGYAGPFILTASGASVLTVSDGVTNGSGNLETLDLPVQMADFGQAGQTIWDVTVGPIAVTGIISDTGEGMAVTGGTTLTLSNLNTYTGSTVISNGATVLANRIADAPCSIGPSGAVVVGANSTLSYTGTATAATARGLSFSGAGAGNINIPNAASLTFNSSVKSVASGTGNLTGNGTLILGGAVDNSGLGMTVGSGTTLVLDKSPSASTVHALGGTTTTINSGGAIKVAGPGSYQLYSTCIIYENSSGVLDFDGQNDSFSTLTLSGTGINNSGALINSSTTASFLTNGGSGIVLAGNTTIGGSGSLGNITLVSKVTGSSALTYAGTGLLTLGGPGTFNGGLNINPGCSVMITAGGYVTGGGGVGPVMIGSNGILILSNNVALANTSVTSDATGTMNIELGGGNLWLTNSLANFLGTYNVYNLASVNGAQLVVGSGSAITPNISASVNWNIYPGVVVDFNVGQINPAPVNLYGMPYSTAGDGALRLDSSTQAGPVILHANSSIGGANAASNSIISGVISGGGFGFTMTGACRMSLTATNTYSGPTAISGGVLALSGNGSISNSAKLSIAAGTTFDVSALNSTTFALSSGTTLSASGKGTTVGSTAASINGAASGGIVNLGAQPVSLTFTPTTFTGDSAHSSLYIPQGTLTLGGNAISVSNAAATPLGAGAYTLIQVASGTISGAPATSVTVTGSGLVPGNSASLSVSGGSVIMTVVAAPTKPAFTSFKVSGTTLMITATNGTTNGNYVLLESTNLSLPLTNWIPVLTNSFDGSGDINLSTNIVNPTIPQEFYIIQNP